MQGLSETRTESAQAPIHSALRYRTMERLAENVPTPSEKITTTRVIGNALKMECRTGQLPTYD